MCKTQFSIILAWVGNHISVFLTRETQQSKVWLFVCLASRKIWQIGSCKLCLKSRILYHSPASASGNKVPSRKMQNLAMSCTIFPFIFHQPSWMVMYCKIFRSLKMDLLLVCQSPQAIMSSVIPTRFSGVTLLMYMCCCTYQK